MITLRPYQIEAVDLLLQKKKAILANPTGSGKTLISLEFAKRLNLPTLIVCQKNKIIDWMNEGEKLGYTDFSIINYSKVHEFTPLKGGLKVIIIDESQNMGNHSTRKGRAMIALCKGADYSLFLSATPLRSSPRNVYWPLKLCGAFDGTLDGFRLRYCGAYMLKGFLVDERGITNKKELQDLVASVSVNTAKNMRIIELDKHFVEIDTGIPRMLNKTRYNVPDFEDTSEIRAGMGDIKLEYFQENWRKVIKEPKAVFFTHHRKFTNGVAEILKCPMIIGGQSLVKKDQAIKEFISKEEGYLVVSMASGSEGLNIPNCKVCYFLELSFSPLTYKQAYSRLVRSMEHTKLKVYFLKIKNEHADILNELKETYLTF